MRSVFAALAILVMATACSAGTRPAEIHNTTHSIVEKTIADRDGAGCSATAIGPQTLLTASHCEMPTSAIQIDDEDIATVVKIVRDENDHTIYYLRGVHFTKWATVSLANDYEPGKRVYMFGNPDGLSDIYREGYMVGQYKYAPGVMLTMYDLNGWFGDSGSGLFNQNGVLVGVVSNLRGPKSLKLMGSFPLAFTQTEINEAVTFTTPWEPKKHVETNPFAEMLKQFQ